MFLLYTDASGTPEKSDPNSKLYTVVGVCIHEGTWFALEKRLRNLKCRYEYQGEPLELHAKYLCAQLRDQESITDFESMDFDVRRQAAEAFWKERVGREANTEKRREREAKYRSFKPYIHLSRRDRSNLFEEALDLIGSHDGIRLFGEVIDKDWFFQERDATDIVQSAFEQIVSRFDAFLQWHNRTLDSGIDNGLLLMDKEPTYEQHISRIFSHYRTNGHPWGKLRHVLESPFFVDSATVSTIQVADLCAYALRRYVERLGNANPYEQANFARIFHKFDRSSARLHGLRHYCKPGSCACRICQERGHTS